VPLPHVRGPARLVVPGLAMPREEMLPNRTTPQKANRERADDKYPHCGTAQTSRVPRIAPPAMPSGQLISWVSSFSQEATRGALEALTLSCDLGYSL
jgi:hypothetical protein